MNTIIEKFSNSNPNKKVQFSMVIIICVIVLFMGYYFDVSNFANILLLMIVCVYVGVQYLGYEESRTSDFNEETLYKLLELEKIYSEYVVYKIRQFYNNTEMELSEKEVEKIVNRNKLRYLYIDTNLIHFLHSLIPVQKYNKIEFFNMLKATDNILEIKKQISRYYQANGGYPDNTAQMFERSITLKTNALNSLHSLIYKLPKNKIFMDYFNKSLYRFNILLSRNLDDIYSYYRHDIYRRGITCNTKFVNYDKTKPSESAQLDMRFFI